MKFTQILALHLLIGVPAAAFTHSVVQFAYDAGREGVEIGWFPVHFVFGLGCGLPILVPAYALQAGLFALLVRLKAHWLAQVAAGAALQAVLVGIWAATVGVQPSLGGQLSHDPCHDRCRRCRWWFCRRPELTFFLPLIALVLEAFFHYTWCVLGRTAALRPTGCFQANNRLLKSRNQYRVR